MINNWQIFLNQIIFKIANSIQNCNEKEIKLTSFSCAQSVLTPMLFEVVQNFVERSKKHLHLMKTLTIKQI